MRGLDDHEDGLNDAAFDRALGIKPPRPPRFTRTQILATELSIASSLSFSPCPVWLRAEALRRLRAGGADTTNRTGETR